MRITTRISHDWLEKGIAGAAGTSATIERVARRAAENLTKREIGTSFEADTDGCVKLTPLGWGFMIADISLDPLRVVNSELPIPVMGYGLRQGRYIILTDYDGGEDEEELYLSEVFATDQDQLVPMAGFECEADAVDLFAGDDGHGHEVRLTRKTVEGLVARGEMTEAALDVDLEHVYLIHPKGFTDNPTMLFHVVAGIGFAREIAKSYEQAMEAEADAVTLRYGAVAAQLTRAATRRKKATRITLKNRKGEVVAEVSAINDVLALKASSRKTFTLLDREATRLSKGGMYRHDGETVCRVVLSVAEVARLYGITEASARRRLRTDFKAIHNECLHIEDGKRWVTVPVSGGAYGIEGDNAFFTFSPDIMRLVLKPTAPQIDLPPELYGTDDTNHAAAFQIGVKLYAHDNQNYGRSNQARMRLTTLLDAAREIPTAEELEKGRRSKTERIMRPFEASMDHLVAKGVLDGWDYCHGNGEDLTPEEHGIIETEHQLGRPAPWDLAKDLLVTWDIGRRYPMHEAERQASRERRLDAAKASKAEREKQAKARQRRIERKTETEIAKAAAKRETGGGE